MDASALNPGFFTRATDLLAVQAADYLSAKGTPIAEMAATRRDELLREMTKSERKAVIEIIGNTVLALHRFDTSKSPTKGRTKRV